MGALLLLLLAQTPQAPGDVAVVVASRREPANAQKVARALAEVLAPTAHVLTEEGAKSRIAELGGVDPVACDGQRLCLIKLAELLGPHATVIGIDVAKAGKFVSAHVEAVGAGKVESLLADDFSSDTKGFDAQSKQWARTFGEKLKDKLAQWNAEVEAAKPKPVVTQTPTPTPAPTPEPIAPPPPPPPVVEQHDQPSHGPAWAATVAAGLLAIGGGVTLGLAISNKTAYDNSVRSFLSGNQNASSLTYSQLNSTVNAANTEFSIALGLGIATVVAVAVAILLFAR
jgi:hypothetical protein